MKLANNDDHRWDLYYKTWLTNNAANLLHPAVSSVQRGYQLPLSGFTAAEIEAGQAQLSEALADMQNLYPDAIPSTFANTLITEATDADDRQGPGYIFHATNAQLEAAKISSNNENLTLIGLDSVRYFNNQITSVVSNHRPERV